jgi:hypothetical protein
MNPVGDELVDAVAHRNQLTCDAAGLNAPFTTQRISRAIFHDSGATPIDANRPRRARAETLRRSARPARAANRPQLHSPRGPLCSQKRGSRPPRPRCANARSAYR